MLFKSENEPDCENQAYPRYDMIPMQLHVKNRHRENDKDTERDDLLNNLQLHQAERSSVSFKADAVGGHL